MVHLVIDVNRIAMFLIGKKENNTMQLLNELIMKIGYGLLFRCIR